MPEWRGWKECSKLTVHYNLANPKPYEDFADVLVAVANGILTIKKGNHETYIRVRETVRWEMVLREFKKCITCDGTGEILNEADRTSYYCMACNGSGRIETRKKEPAPICPACEGRGWCYVRPGDETRANCERCNGTGEAT